MAKLKLKFRDISRMTKKYPYTRHLPRTQLVSDKEFDLEIITLDVTNVYEQIITWEKTFEDIPNVTVTIALIEDDSSKIVYDSAGNKVSTASEMANVNVWIKQVTETNCTVAFSDEFTGTINVQAIRFS